MTEITAKRPYSRRRRWLLIALALVLVILLVRTGMGVWVNWRIAAEVSRLEQKYGNLEVSLIAAPVSPDDNRARVMRAAAALVKYAPNTHFNSLQPSFSSFLKKPVPATLPVDLRAFVEANGEAFRVAADARARSQSNWEADYLAESNVPRWLDIRALSNALYLAANLELERGRADDAAQSIASGLALSASIRQEPSLIAQLMRMAFGFQHFEAVQRLLIQSDPSEASLAELAKWLAENRPQPMDIGLLSELKYFNAKVRLVVGENVVSDTGTTGSGFVAMLAGAQASPFWARPLVWLGRPWVRLLWLDYLEQMGRLIEVQSGPRPRPAGPVTPVTRHGSFFTRSNWATGLERAMETGDMFSSGRGLTELAIALRRYRIANGQYPDELTMLVPTYLPSVPLDPFTGKPPVYSRQDKGFTLRGEKAGSPAGSTAAVLEWNVSRQP